MMYRKRRRLENRGNFSFKLFSVESSNYSVMYSISSLKLCGKRFTADNWAANVCVFIGNLNAKKYTEIKCTKISKAKY